MPRKRKTSNLTGHKNAKRQKRLRENQTDDERQIKALNCCIQNRYRRQNESESARLQRNTAVAVTDQTRRQTESDVVRSQRIIAVASRNKSRRLNETAEERSQRITTVVASNRRRHLNETNEERLRRLAAIKITNYIRRIAETNKARRARILVDNAAHRQRRSTLSQLSDLNIIIEDQILEPSAVAPIDVVIGDHHININVAISDCFNESEIVEHYCGLMNSVCRFCGSFNFDLEKTSKKLFKNCCHMGKVDLPSIRIAPEIQNLMTRTDTDSNNFRQNMRQYNCAFAFVSMGAQIQKLPGRGPYCFKIQGQIYHVTGPLHPAQNTAPQFAQMYVLDPDVALQERMGHPANSVCRPNIMQQLDTLLRRINPFAQAYMMMSEVEENEIFTAAEEGRRMQNVTMTIVNDRHSDPRRYNAQKCNEVAFVFSSADGAPPFDRDIRIHLRGSTKTQTVSILNCHVDAMTYPLLFPYGDSTWKEKIPYTNQQKGNVTQLQFYSFLLAVRDYFNPLLYGGKLFQQFVVDAYCKIEASRLRFIELNQKRLRVESYSTLKRHIDNRAANLGLKPGKQVVLPSTFEGSDRALKQHYEDAMAVVGAKGKPDYFITMTANPKWTEILENLAPGQTSSDRPDLVSRVFRLKLKSLMKDITKHHVLGTPNAHMYVIEFQKRGLPHAHILIIMEARDKPKEVETIDSAICAEIPNEVQFPRLHEIVLRNMIHGPCGSLNPNSPCMDDKQCTKQFPKEIAEKTDPDCQGYPLYRRRALAKTYTVGKYQVDNTWVVPYNPFLLLKYNCHINVEVCASIKSVKYLYKYVYKGHDCANVEIRTSDNESVLEHDEIKTYLNSRYVSPPEALWRIYEFHLHKQSHAIQRLSIHLPGEQAVYFDDGDEIAALQRSSEKDDTLTAFFLLNQEDPSARQHLYREIPQHYTFVAKTHKWKTREGHISRIVGRIYTVSVRQGELYYLRVLLLHVPGPTSYEDIRTVDGVTYPTFKEAAIQLNLLADDTEWVRAMTEASAFQMPYQLRQLLAMIFVFSDPQDPRSLWDTFLPHLIEDYTHRGFNDVDAAAEALLSMEHILNNLGKHTVDYGLPPPPLNRPMVEEINIASAQNEGQRLSALLNSSQRRIFDAVLKAVEDPQLPKRLFFLNGPGGTGKTFAYLALYHTIVGLGKKVTCCAATGIAATLLPFGQTYHSTFKLPVPLLRNSSSNIRATTQLGKSLIETNVIFWDECTLTPYFALDAVNKLLSDLTNSDKPFGGKIMVLGGDFRQCLPIVPKAGRGRIVETAINNSPVWPLFEHFHLSINMRLTNDDPTFQDWLLKLGNGNVQNDCNLGVDIIEIPAEYVETGCIIQSTFGETLSRGEIAQYCQRAILTPKNNDVHLLNRQILNKLPGEMKNYLSVDSIDVENEDETHYYTDEFLHSLTPSGMPPHKLQLKVGATVMLLRNLNTKRGLCNGTRLTIQRLDSNVVTAIIVTGMNKGDVVLLPRIDLVSSEVDIPFKLKRRQFPINVSFAMTINKAQGQSLDYVGIYLPQPMFSHGQLYVAMSRTKDPRHLKIQVVDTQTQGRLLKPSQRVFTRNVVYREILPPGDTISVPPEPTRTTRNFIRPKQNLRQSTVAICQELGQPSTSRFVPHLEQNPLCLPFNSRGFVNNNGVSCYANSVLQCVFQIPALRKNLVDAGDDTLFPLLWAFVDCHVPLSSDSICHALGGPYRTQQQQDASEFLLDMINRWVTLQNSLRYHDQTTIVCGTCNYSNTTSNSDFLVSLHIGNTPTDLQSMFQERSDWEDLLDFVCPQCCNTMCRKQTTITQTSEIVICHFIIFNGLEKITNFKLEDPTKSQIVIQNSTYEPCAAIFHHGDTIQSGHYTSYQLYQNNWFHSNDCIVKVDTWPVDSEDVYLIFLRKIN